MNPRVAEAAEAIAAGRLTLSDALKQNWSTSQQVVLALVAGEPGAAEEPYNSPAAAWGRLDDRQRALVERLAPSVVERFNLRR